MRLSRDDILKAEDRKAEKVDCPEWGGSVLVRGMSGRERDAFEISLQEQRGNHPPVRNLANLRAKIVSRCVVDEEGNRVFSDADAAALGDKCAAPIDRIFDAASRLSGLGEQDVKEMAANFGGANGGGSSSASPPVLARQSKGSSPR